MPLHPVPLIIGTTIALIGSSYAFKKFIYDPHLAHYVEAFLAHPSLQQLRDDYLPMRDEVSSSSRQPVPVAVRVQSGIPDYSHDYIDEFELGSGGGMRGGARSEGGGLGTGRSVRARHGWAPGSGRYRDDHGPRDSHDHGHDVGGLREDDRTGNSTARERRQGLRRRGHGRGSSGEHESGHAHGGYGHGYGHGGHGIGHGRNHSQGQGRGSYGHYHGHGHEHGHRRSGSDERDGHDEHELGYQFNGHDLDYERFYGPGNYENTHAHPSHAHAAHVHSRRTSLERQMEIDEWYAPTASTRGSASPPQTHRSPRSAVYEAPYPSHGHGHWESGSELVFESEPTRAVSGRDQGNFDVNTTPRTAHSPPMSTHWGPGPTTYSYDQGSRPPDLSLDQGKYHVEAGLGAGSDPLGFSRPPPEHPAHPTHATAQATMSADLIGLESDSTLGYGYRQPHGATYTGSAATEYGAPYPTMAAIAGTSLETPAIHPTQSTTGNVIDHQLADIYFVPTLTTTVTAPAEGVGDDDVDEVVSLSGISTSDSHATNSVVDVSTEDGEDVGDDNDDAHGSVLFDAAFEGESQDGLDIVSVMSSDIGNDAEGNELDADFDANANADLDASLVGGVFTQLRGSPIIAAHDAVFPPDLAHTRHPAQAGWEGAEAPVYCLKCGRSVSASIHTPEQVGVDARSGEGDDGSPRIPTALGLVPEGIRMPQIPHATQAPFVSVGASGSSTLETAGPTQDREGVDMVTGYESCASEIDLVSASSSVVAISRPWTPIASSPASVSRPLSPTSVVDVSRPGSVAGWTDASADGGNESDWEAVSSSGGLV